MDSGIEGATSNPLPVRAFFENTKQLGRERDGLAECLCPAAKLAGWIVAAENRT